MFVLFFQVRPCFHGIIHGVMTNQLEYFTSYAKLAYFLFQCQIGNSNPKFLEIESGELAKHVNKYSLLKNISSKNYKSKTEYHSIVRCW